MRYVYWVINQSLGGRPSPQVAPWNPGELYDGGIRTVVSLSQEEETEDLTQYNLTHYRAGFPPVLLYSKGMQRAFIFQALPVWDFIHEELAMEKPVLVHCYHGKDRTGAMLAGYLIVYHGVEPRDALARLRAVKPDAMTAEGYAGVLDLLVPGELPDPRTLL